jgi:hypothetical protein
MCGIVGLFLKDRALEPRLGAMLTEMLVTMTDRGPDSAGLAVSAADTDGEGKLTIRSTEPERDFDGLAGALEAEIGLPVRLTPSRKIRLSLRGHDRAMSS